MSQPSFTMLTQNPAGRPAEAVVACALFAGASVQGMRRPFYDGYIAGWWSTRRVHQLTIFSDIIRSRPEWDL